MKITMAVGVLICQRLIPRFPFGVHVLINLKVKLHSVWNDNDGNVEKWHSESDICEIFNLEMDVTLCKSFGELFPKCLLSYGEGLAYLYKVFINSESFYWNIF